MNEDGTPIVENPAESPASTNPNDLDFVMTPEQEQEYVNQVLNGGDYTPPVDDEPVAPVNDSPEEVVPQPAVGAPAVEPVVPKPAEDTPTIQSDDLWVEVEQVVTDELGEESTKTVKLVYDPADPNSFIPDDFQAKNTKQLAEIMDAKNEMASLYKERQADFDKAESVKNAAKQESDLIASWDAEISDLIKSKLIEEPKLKPGDEKYDEDPSVVKTNAVFQYLTEKNDARAKEGLPPITSFAMAFTMFEGDQAQKAAAEAQQKADEETKKKGAMVGGGSAASGGTAEQHAYVSGSHQNIWSIPVE